MLRLYFTISDNFGPVGQHKSNTLLFELGQKRKVHPELAKAFSISGLP